MQIPCGSSHRILRFSFTGSKDMSPTSFFLFLESPSIWSTFQPKLVKVKSLHGVLYCTHGLEIGQKDFCDLGVLNLSFSNSIHTKHI